jgi:orotate phosphoribosyltransferase
MKTSSPANAKARLIRLIEEKSLGRGPEISLASGRTSTFYFDMKPTIFDPEGASLIARLLLERLHELGADYVGGLEMGAVPLVGCVCQASHENGPPIPGFFVRKQPKDHGTGRTIEGIPGSDEVRGMRAVLVEDVTTTGGSVLKAVDAARAAGLVVGHVVTVVDRLEGAREILAGHDIELVALTTAGDFGI